MLLVPFVGRGAELASLADAVRSACRLLLVTGDAGVGKTRLVAEAVRGAVAGGSLVLQAACLPLDIKLPLLPFIEALRGLDRSVGPSALAGALTAMPTHAVDQLARLAPEIVGRAVTDDDLSDQHWQQARLFAAVDQVLAQVAGGRHVVLVVEDIHWADVATLDLMTYLRASRSGAALTLLVTCRGDEAPLEPYVSEWLGHARRSDAIRLELSGLARDELAELVAHVLTDKPSDAFVDELRSRTDGNPYLAEELIAAAVSRSRSSRTIALPSRVPGELAEILVGRARRIGESARATLDVLAVAGRPMPEGLVAKVTGLAPRVVASAMHELAEARLLAIDDARSDVGCRPRHALLAEAISANLLADELRQLHARVAEALESLADPALSAEIAGHWAAAERPDDELRALVAAAESSRRVYAFSEAAEFWLRAIGLAESRPGSIDRLEVDPARLRLKAVDALRACGRDTDAGALAEETYRDYGAHTDQELAAMIRESVAIYWMRNDPAAALIIFAEAARLYEGLPESASHARMLASYGVTLSLDGRSAESVVVYQLALDIADRTGARHEAAEALCGLAEASFRLGDVDQGFVLLDRARQLYKARADSDRGIWAQLYMAGNESCALSRMGRLSEAEHVAFNALDRAQRHGVGRGDARANLLVNAADASVERGLIEAAAHLTDEITDHEPQADDEALHLVRAMVEICQDATERAVARMDAVDQLGLGGPRLHVYDRQLVFAWVALWAGDPRDALAWVERSLAGSAGTDVELFCGRIFALGARAVADLVELARVLRDEEGQRDAGRARDRLTTALAQMGGRPLADHAYVASIPGDRADWDAELHRSIGRSDPDAWQEAAAVWHRLGRPHRAAYALWRQAEALLSRSAATSDAAIPLRAAAEAAAGMVPLQKAIQRLADRARISLHTSVDGATVPQPRPADPYGLTKRERLVLQLVAQGRTNVQIGAELFMSPKTASVHVTNILRKLNVANRTEAAAVAERAGLTENVPGL